MVRYFAYGSNMAEDVMALQCPNHQFVGRALLRDHRLLFTRRSIRTGTGVADVVPSPGDRVWGALYEIDEAGLAALDRKEGQGWAYARHEAAVLPDGRPPAVPVELYRVVHPERDEVRPSPEYVSRLLRAAGERGLPEDYVAELDRWR